MNLPNWMRRIADRRKANRPVDKDRRGGGTGGKRKEVEQRLYDAIDDLERTVSVKRDELLKRLALTADNDRQQVVIFSTFREICADKLDAGEHRLCRNPAHAAANTGIAKCDEQLCPRIDQALKGAA